MLARLASTLLLIALAGCGVKARERQLYVSGSTDALAEFVAKERSCRPKLKLSRPRSEQGTRSQIVVQVPKDYSDSAVAQLAREAKAAGLHSSLN